MDEATYNKLKKKIEKNLEEDANEREDLKVKERSKTVSKK